MINNTKIIYLAPFEDGTGYANAAINTVLSMDAAGIDVIPRSIKLCGQFIKPPDRITELMKKPTNNATHLIQHYLPHMITYRSGFKNISFFHCETDSFKSSGWQHYLNLMDEIWVSCDENVEAAIKSGVTKPIKVVPIGCNTSVYNKFYPKLPINTENRFVFYHIGDYSERKGTERLIRSYFESFNKSDNVVLVLKCFREGMSPQESQEFITNQIQLIKKKMRLYNVDNYPPIIIISGYISSEELYSLHQMSDCFISLECGAAWNIPSYDAMGFGKRIIVTGYGGQTQFIKDNPPDYFCLPYTMESVYGMDHVSYQGVYTSREKWAIPKLDNAKLAMRTVYNHWLNNKDYKINNQLFLENWSLKSCGDKIKTIMQNNNNIPCNCGTYIDPSTGESNGCLTGKH